MFNFLFKKQEIDKKEIINKNYSLIKSLYLEESVPEKRKQELSSLIEKYGYLPYPHVKVLEELTDEEVIFCLEKKLELNNAFKDEVLVFNENEISPVKRHRFHNADWIKREQHDIKLVNLSALGDEMQEEYATRFIDWIRQIIMLPSGNLAKNILSTTIYLVPFHPRDFGNAYLTASSEEVSKKLTDKELELKGLSGEEQIKMFITLAQLAGHPVIYDVFPQMGRYSKTILAHPEIVRWVDVKFLTEEISKSLNYAAIKLSKEFDEDDVTIVKNIYKTTLKSGSIDLSSEFQPIYDRFTQELEDKNKELSNHMAKKEQQKKLQKRVKNIVAKVQGVNSKKIKCDNDITKRGETINALIEEGLWTLPDGAWCSSGIPIFEKMAECGSYPMFRHYDANGLDVSEFAESDCQSPLYFVYLESGDYNLPVINFYLDYLQTLQQDYNFDGFRISHTDFVVDEMSESKLRPISYRAPRFLLKKANEILKKRVPHFACMAEYRLRGAFYKEYHQDMGFDIFWGNDTKTDYEKNPSEVIENNRELQTYNNDINNKSQLSIIKTYNNQDGDFRTVNRYLGLMDKEEALFKWFKFKFLPAGKLAQRPVMYVDGDESFSKDGIEATIQEEVALIRENDEDFFYRFDAIRRFALNNELTIDGEAQIINNSKNGFVSWMISKETLKESLIVVANYLPANEKILKQNTEGIMEYKVKTNFDIEDKKVELPSDYTLACEYVYEPEKKDFVEHYFAPDTKTIEIEKLEPSEFRIYKIKR